MEVKTFTAARFDEALAQIKRELGPDAVILSSKEVSNGGSRTDRWVQIEATTSQEVVSRRRTPTPSSAPSDPDENRLVRSGVPPFSARRIARTLALPSLMADDRLSRKKRLATSLQEEILFAGAISKSESRVVALVGPTGVGKTTTVAKLAANAALIRKWTVGVISLDNYRIGAIEQLERYSDLIGIPMQVAYDALSLNEALSRLRHVDLVLIDTAGRASRDSEAHHTLAECFRKAQEPVQVHLCLQAAMRDQEMMATIERMACLEPTRLTITKLDEAMQHGSILAAQVWSRLPLAYFTNGQRVPEDIEVAGSERLAELLTEEEVSA